MPAIVGDLDTEVTLFLSPHLPELATIDEASVVRILSVRLGGEEAARGVLSTYRGARPEATPYELLARIMSAAAFGVETQRAARTLGHSGGGRAWTDRITWRTPVDGGDLMSPHELDVALTFGNVDVVVGVNGGGSGARELARTIKSLWVSFARTGDLSAESGIAWPECDAGGQPVLVLDPAPRVRDDLDVAELDTLAKFLQPGVGLLSLAGE